MEEKKDDMVGDHGKMRLILIIISFVNIFLYYTAYAYFDNILVALARYELSVGFLTFLKYFIIFVLGFLIGFLIILSMRLRVSMNYFDLKGFLMVGLIPVLAIILSYSGLVSFLVNTFFKSNGTINELYYYFFSRTDIWSLWLGVATGSSIRLKLLQKRKYKHQAME
ncbi:MAG: hypothetical protein KAI62_02260 [Actinomycetia bacterium]|nr:hypothetical protein [Actinomycetes bacterium]